MNKFYNGKIKKAITLSFDDGITQDKRLIEILNKYGLKCTFNLNSGLLGKADSLIRDGVTVAHVKPSAEEIKEIYKDHEVAVHTLTHPLLTTCTEEEIICQVENDRKALSEIVGYDVKCMAYPCGGQNNDERVADVVRKYTGIEFSRTIKSTYNFDIQSDLLRYNPTVYHREKEKMFELANEFINLKSDDYKIFYIWGHSYEFDIDNSWEWFENFCKTISNKKDIFYGTNSEVLL